MRYTFKKYEDLKNVVSMDLVESNIDLIYEYFMQNMVDILYIMKDGKLDAIASPGDVHKFYLGEGKYRFAINKKFSFLEEVDYDKALKKVDFLYIFVVEENRSVFSFEDRLQMVKEGVRDLENVQVIPSGKYIISKDTFAQYFEKDNVTEVESMDYDVRIFGEIVAPGFHISYRFVGEEPFDLVTKQYNVTLKNILPQYGVKVEEISRKHIKGRNEVINATAVRNLIKNGGVEELEQYCPESTIKYLKEMQLINDISK